MDLSGQWLTDIRIVPVGPNSTVVAGANAKRRRLSIYPIGTIPVFISPGSSAVINGGAVVAQGSPPLIFGDGDTPGIVDYGVNGITAGGTQNVMVIDEFLG